MSEKEIKVTDRRMFTSDGELREEYRHLEEKAAAAAESPGAADPPRSAGGSHGADAAGGGAASEPAAAGPPAGPGPGPSPGAEAAGLGSEPRLEFPDAPEGMGPTFYDLLGVLAEPVALYLGDAELPDGSSMENLEMARMYIDLLDVLRKKTVGNLSVQELATLDDVLYRLRMRYVQKRG